MTAFELSIYSIVRIIKDSKRFFTVLEESNETFFQMKGARDVFFKELQLNMDNVLKSHVIYKKRSLKTVQNETHETIVGVDIHSCQMKAAEKRSCQIRLVPNDDIIIIEEIASDPEWWLRYSDTWVNNAWDGWSSWTRTDTGKWKMILPLVGSQWGSTTVLLYCDVLSC